MSDLDLIFKSKDRRIMEMMYSSKSNAEGFAGIAKVELNKRFSDKLFYAAIFSGASALISALVTLIVAFLK